MPRRLAIIGHCRTPVVPGNGVTRDKLGTRKRRRGAVSRVSRVSRADFVKVRGVQEVAGGKVGA